MTWTLRWGRVSHVSGYGGAQACTTVKALPLRRSVGFLRRVCLVSETAVTFCEMLLRGFIVSFEGYEVMFLKVQADRLERAFDQQKYPQYCACSVSLNRAQ